MPNRDATGPNGMGPKTGRGIGPCGGGSGAGYGRGMGRGRGFGRAMCGQFWRGFRALPKTERKEILEEEITDLKQELETTQGELKELDK